ncbi:LuxR C-terminal-related transcriptional regulator [Actinosynnema sp. CS-041913]|uniref:helix-turn-helix transcriptional regulator n=1 Tax=Actinosynnema sp. CS-041913 TaxID=3239917 RepID=UPI003D916CEF
MGWPFVGRAEELAAVRAALRGAGLVVAGPAGVGKTRLLEEALTTPLVRATSASRAIPLGALGPLLPAEIPDGPLAMLRAARESLRGKVIGIDDAHLLDDTSAVVLHQLVQHGEAVVLVTIRSGERAPAPVTALWKDQLLGRLDLAPLGRADVEEVLAAALGGPVDSRAVDRFRSATEGNVLLLRELLLASTMVQRDGVWRLDGPWSMPPRLVELIEDRLGTVSDARRRILELLAFGEPLDVGLFAAADLESLSDAGLVTLSDGVRLAHPLYGEALRAGCSTVRAHNHQRRLATLLDDPMRVAVLRLESGTADDPDLLLTAARRACATLDVGLAERLARAAWAVGGGPPAGRLLAQILGFTDRPEEAEAVHAMISSADDPPELVAARAMNLRWGLGRGADAAALPGLIPAVRAFLLFDAGEHEAARRALRGEDPGEAVIEAMIDAITGRPVKEFPALPRLGAIPLGLDTVRSAEWFVRMMTGDLLAAEAIAESAHAEKDNWDAMRTQWAVHRATTARLRGKVSDAHRLLWEAEPSTMPSHRRLQALIELAAVEVLRGNDGRGLLAEAEALRPDLHGNTHFTLEHTRIWVTGASPFAAADAARKRGELAVEASMLHDAVRLGHPRQAVDRLGELAATVHGLLAPLYFEHAEALVRKDKAALEQVAHRFSAVGADLYAAEAAAASGNRALCGRLAARCQGARTPALTAFAVPRLTKRELEVASLATRGMTNREIAEALVTSVRTVDNHLSSAYAKLGITARTELADALGR